MHAPGVKKRARPARDPPSRKAAVRVVERGEEEGKEGEGRRMATRLFCVVVGSSRRQRQADEVGIDDAIAVFAARRAFCVADGESIAELDTVAATRIFAEEEEEEEEEERNG